MLSPENEDNSYLQVIYLLNGNDWQTSTGRVCGMWYGSWMGVDGECVCSWMGVYGEWVRLWIYIDGEWRMDDVHWMYRSNREWRIPQTKTNMDIYETS